MADAGAVPATLRHLPAPLLQPLPFFVYGTLMEGFANHASVVRRRHAGAAPAALRGVELWHFAGFPGVYDAPARDAAPGAVCGELLAVDAATPLAAAAYLALLEELDALEEFYGPGDARNVYEREARDVLLLAGGARDGGGGGESCADAPAAAVAADAPAAAVAADAPAATATVVRAWVYIARFDRAAAGGVRVAHGDWRRHMRERALADAGDDWAATLAAKRAAAAAAEAAAAPAGVEPAAAGTPGSGGLR